MAAPSDRPTAAAPTKPPRRRNVVSRGRTGCLTCRRRRLKCDEAKPGCNNCKRIKVTCEGYSQKITFRDQTNLTVQRATGKTTTEKKTTTTTSQVSPPQPPQPSPSSSGVVKDEESGGEDVFAVPFQFVDCSNEINESSGSSSSPESSSKDSVNSPENVVRQSQPTVPSSSSPPVYYEDSQTSVMAASNSWPTPNLPSPSRVLSNSSLGVIGAFEFPEDYTYFEYSAGGSFASISRVLPLAELLQTEPVSPHVYNAAIALAALTLSSSEQYQTGAITLRRHAFYHSLKAVQGLQKELMEPRGSGRTSNALRADTSFSLFATIMLAANFELQRGSVLSWHAHMRGAASCLNGAHAELLKKPTGMLLIVAFARMALLLRMYNEDYSVTTPEYMSPSLAHWLNRLLQESSRPHDQILLLVEEVTKLEIQKRTHPAQEPTWSIHSADLIRRLDLWRDNLPSSELPVDDHTPNGAFLTISSSHYAGDSCNGNGSTSGTPPSSPEKVESLIRIPALCFPHSPDPCVAAVNYSTYLCTRMRTETRYSAPSSSTPSSPSGINLDRELPPHCEQTALAICRIAAGSPPTRFSASFTYSYGMLPSVFGAYRWSKNQGLRSWAKHWLSGYRTTREGIWNVSQTLRLIALIDPVHRCDPSPTQTRMQIRSQGQGQGQSQGQSQGSGQEQNQERAFVALRTVDEPVDPSPELEEGDVERPFKIVLSTRGENEEGSSSNVVMVK